MNPATAYHQLKNILAKTKLECAAKLAQLWDALKEPTLDQPKPEILLADWLDLCYQEYKKPNLLPNTQMSYERRIYQHPKVRTNPTGQVEHHRHSGILCVP